MRRVVATVAVIATALTLSAPTAANALVDPAPTAVTAVATLTKTASATRVSPGETFTYTLTMGCSSITDTGCRDAVLSDVVPAPFEVVSAVVGGGANTASAPIVNGNAVTVNWTTPLGDGTVGIVDATTGVVEITARLPMGTSYDLSGVEVLNAAALEGTNFTDVQDQVGVTPVITLDLATTATKTFSPTTAVATPATPVTAQLGGSNGSNATVDTLTVQDPADPDAAANPFGDLGFTGFGAVTAPTGATSTDYQVYVGTAWVPAPDGTLPSGVSPEDVRGARVIFSGAIPAAATGGFALDLQVTPLAASRPDGAVVANTVRSVVGLGDQTTSADAEADFTLRQNAVAVTASKSFAPALVIAGQTSIATLGATNSSTIPIDSLTITEPSSGSFPAAYAFDGFTTGVTYPAGVTGARVIYHFADGTEEVPFGNGATPIDPATHPIDAVTSFEVVFTGTAIEPGATTSVSFRVATDPELTSLPSTVTNEVGVTGTHQGATGSASASDDLYVYDEVIETDIGKSIRPSKIVAAPGEPVTISLTGGTTERPDPPTRSTGTTGYAQQIVIQDPQDPPASDPWWNAFDLTAVTQTPVPAASTLTIEYLDTTDGVWKALAGPVAGPTIFSAAVPANISSVAGGVRFVYDHTGAGRGFAPGTDLAPNFTSSLRSDGRYTPGPPFTGEVSTFVPNCAQSGATSATPGVAPASSVMPIAECPSVEIDPVDPGTADLIDKTFGTSSSGGVKSVIARSGDTIPSVLGWSTGGFSNLGSVQLTDTADPAGTPLAQSVFNAFDLRRVEPIAPATDPFIVYDQVQQVLLYNGREWVDAVNDPCPEACIGQFPGVTLTGGETASTTGVRLVVVESPDRAAASVGHIDAPPVGSGVARSFGNSRPVTLTWQVRDARRSDGTPVLGDELYNQPDDGVVRNTVNATGFPSDASAPLSSNDQDDVVIIDVPITTTTDKTWEGGPMAVPPDPTIGATQFPVSRFTVTTRNTTPARVDQLQITDPGPGSVLGRQTDAFGAFSFVSFSSISVPTGTSTTTVRLFCPDGTFADYSRNAALALTAQTVPCDITGYQVTFAGRIGAGAAGSVATTVRLRDYFRGSGDRVSPAESPISNTAQGIVADVDPIGPCPPAGEVRYACDDATANIVLESPTFGVISSKSIAPAQQKENDFAPVTVTLTGQPTGSARTVTMTLADNDPSFWNAVDFVGMSPGWRLPAPLGLVEACYTTGGVFTPQAVADDTVGGTQTCSGLVPLATAKAFLTAAPRDLHGVSFRFAQANQLGWTFPTNPVVTVPFQVMRRVDLRSGGPVPTTRSDQVPAPGESQAGVFTDTITADSRSIDLSPGEFLTANSSAEAQYRNLHLQATISVTKSPNGDVQPGVAIPFTLSFTNSGESPLTDPVFSDELPTDTKGAQLIFDPDRDPSVSPYTFALAGPTPNPPNGGTLPVDESQIQIDETTTRIVFRMPPGSVLEPGQTYTITIQLMLRPGLTPADSARNWASVEANEPFDGCVPTYDAATGLCRDDAIVRPLSVPAVRTIKYVKADAPVNEPGVPEVLSVANDYSCEGTATPGGFYRAPCVPVSRPGGTETWRFTVTNAGTLPLDQVVAIDNLPTPGDRGLIAVLPRGSIWQPTFVGNVRLLTDSTSPSTPVLTTFYSTSSVPCTADLNPLGTQCAPEAWLPLGDGVDPAIVRSVKFVIGFPTDNLQPGESIDIQFQTSTTPDELTATDYPIAYNTVSTGGSALSSRRVAVPATEGRRVGVAYPTGPISIEKIVSGDARELAPARFPVQLECALGGVPISGTPSLVLVRDDPPQTVRGLPLGAECTAVEGQYGQTRTLPGRATVGGPDDPLGRVSVENVYDVADFTIRKVVDAAGSDARGNPISYGPFSFSVSCTFLGLPVFADGYGPDQPMRQSIGTDETWALAGLPVGAECTIVEDDPLGASGTSFVVTQGGDDQPPVDGDSFDVTVAEGEPVGVIATNTFGAGSLALEKVIAGPGAADFGRGPFVLAVNCVLDTGSGPASVWLGSVSLGGDRPLSATIDGIAAGATCSVTEPGPAGTTVTIEPDEVVVADGETVGVTVTNYYDAGALTVRKTIDGPGAERYGTGPFEVTLTCLDRFERPVEIPGGATRVLDDANEYTATYDPLLVGLTCTVDETDTGGATTVQILDVEGRPLPPVTITADTTEVGIVNTFEVGSVTIAKTVSGDAASEHSDDVFPIAVACAWRGEPVDVPGGAARTVAVGGSVTIGDLPVGAECTVKETDAGGAASVTYTPADPADPTRALVVVGQGAPASIGIDNRFDPPPTVTAPLPATGVDGRALLIAGGVAGILILAGVIVMIVVRRRRRS
ncbi:DUF5979 domain-containing protein [uncultured Microbacterium sp.]|uniref:DUF5979 domain-containing protein n=1 Tax=uncultured Microbacterium sp. TaxID=191216 RepID=UPI0035C9F27E